VRPLQHQQHGHTIGNARTGKGERRADKDKGRDGREVRVKKTEKKEVKGMKMDGNKMEGKGKEGNGKKVEGWKK